jgi:hypothetical protein
VLWLLMNRENLSSAQKVPQRRGPVAGHRGRPRRRRYRRLSVRVSELKIMVCLAICYPAAGGWATTVGRNP